MSEFELSEKQLDLLKRALGVDSTHPFYRNFFAVSVEDEPDNEAAWQELISQGFAHVAKEPCSRMNCRIYAATEKGKRLVSDKTGIVPFVER